MISANQLPPYCGGHYSLDLFHAVLDGLEEGIILLDGQGHIRYWNSWMDVHAGLSCQDVVGRTLDKVFPGVVSSRMLNAVEWALTRRLPAMLSPSLNKAPLPLEDNGQLIEQSIHVMPIDVPEEGLQCLVRVTDVTSIVEKERLLRTRARQLKELAGVDPLTGVANRRQFDEELGNELCRHRRSEEPISVLMLDIDYFKAYNDTYGHLLGDECLMAVSASIGHELRRGGDLLARIGGEEFAVILPDTDAEGIVHIAESIRKGVEEQAIPHLGSKVSQVVTLSVGGATARNLDRSQVNDLMSAADAALYDAKRSGRNTCRFVKLGPSA